MKKSLSLFFALIIFSCVVCFPITADAATFNIDFNTTTESITLINLDTDTPVYQKNPDVKRSPASITKIMTYIVVSEHVPDLEGTTVTVTNEILEILSGTGSSISGLAAGETLSVYQLLHCLMIPSGNDAALVLADYVGNHDVMAFVEMMNEKALELGCNNTHFMNPHGLYDPEHYTTANDMAKITTYAMKLPHFSEITNETVSYILGDDWPLVTTNSLIDPINGGSYYYKYAKGIKTGHLDEAGYCLVSTAVRGGYTYLCVAMGAPSIDIKTNGAMVDSKSLYIWAFDNLEIKTVISSEQPVREVDLEYAWNKDSILLVPAKDFSTVLPVNVEISSIDISTDVPESIKAPVEAGEKVGTATLSYANQPLATIDLVASESVERSQFLYSLSVFKNIVTSKWFIISVVIVVVLLVIYLILTMIYNNRGKKKRKVENYRKF